MGSSTVFQIMTGSNISTGSILVSLGATNTFTNATTLSSTLAVTGATTLTGLLTLGGGTDLLAISGALSTYNGSNSDISLGNSQPSIQYASSPDWIRITVGGNPYYIPIWSAAPPM